MEKRALTDADSVAKLLSEVLGRDVSAGPSEVSPEQDSDVYLIATYADSDGLVAAACVCDLQVAAGLGAALSLVPTVRMDENIKARQLDEVFMENLHEVCNIAARLFNSGSESFVILADLLSVPPVLPADLDTVYAPLIQRLDLEVAIAGYGSGKMAFLSA